MMLVEIITKKTGNTCAIFSTHLYEKETFCQQEAITHSKSKHF